MLSSLLLFQVPSVYSNQVAKSTGSGEFVSSSSISWLSGHEPVPHIQCLSFLICTLELLTLVGTYRGTGWPCCHHRWHKLFRDILPTNSLMAAGPAAWQLTPSQATHYLLQTAQQLVWTSGPLALTKALVAAS